MTVINTMLDFDKITNINQTVINEINIAHSISISNIVYNSDAFCWWIGNVK